MSDNCQHCTVRGNLKECEETTCHMHDSWYAKAIKAKVSKFTKEDLIGLVQWCCDANILYRFGNSSEVVDRWLKERNKK